MDADRGFMARLLTLCSLPRTNPFAWYFFVMNDPHVVALIYKIEHGPSVDYSKAEPLDREETNFRVQITNEEVRFEFKEHYATEDAARKAIKDYIRAWEFDAGLRRGPDYFKLKFDQPKIEDRNPTPGVIELSGHARTGVPTATGKLTVNIVEKHYPPRHRES